MAWTDVPAAFLSPLLPFGIIVGAGLIVGLLVGFMGRLGAVLALRGKPHPDERLARKLPVPLGVASGLIAALIALDLVAQRVESVLVVQTRRVLVSILVVASAWVFMRVVRLVLERVAQRRIAFQPATLVTNRLVSLWVYAAALLAILHQYGLSITPLLTGLGIAALAVGLALQDTLSNFFAGLWIQTEQPVAPGHYVRIEGQNVEGFVEKVGWRTTRIRVLAGNLVVLPNSRLAQATVTDFTLPQPMMSVVMNFRLPFDVDPQRAMTILVEEAKEAAKVTPGLLADPVPFSNATPGIGEYGIGYSLIIKVREFTDQWNAQTAVTSRIWARLHKEGIHLPYPTRLNLQASGEPFAPKSMVRVSKQVDRTPEGLDPMQKEALEARAQIQQQRAQEAKQEGRPAPPPPPAPGPATTPTSAAPVAAAAGTQAAPTPAATAPPSSADSPPSDANTKAPDKPAEK